MKIRRRYLITHARDFLNNGTRLDGRANRKFSMKLIDPTPSPLLRNLDLMFDKCGALARARARGRCLAGGMPNLAVIKGDAMWSAMLRL